MSVNDFVYSLYWKARWNAGIHSTQMLLNWKRRGYLDGIEVAIDVGAHVGHFTAGLKCALPQAHVIAFEPYAPSYQLLRERFAGRSGLEVHPFALGACDSVSDLFVSEMEQTNSLLRMSKSHTDAWPGSAPTGIQKVKVTTLDKILLETRLNGQCFLKLDVQGSELEVLRGARNVLARTRAVQMEVNIEPLYDGCPSPSDVITFMTDQRFRLVDAIDFLVPPHKQFPASCDMLFVNITR